jgi:hypothetical protein
MLLPGWQPCQQTSVVFEMRRLLHLPFLASGISGIADGLLLRSHSDFPVRYLSGFARFKSSSFSLL